MKKLKPVIAILFIACTLSSCATVFGGPVNSYQRTRPLPGQQQRPLRPAAFVADLVLFWPGLIVDFATGAIYKPHPHDAPPETPSTTPPVSTAQSSN